MKLELISKCLAGYRYSFPGFDPKSYPRHPLVVNEDALSNRTVGYSTESLTIGHSG